MADYERWFITHAYIKKIQTTTAKTKKKKRKEKTQPHLRTAPFHQKQ